MRRSHNHNVPQSAAAYTEFLVREGEESGLLDYVMIKLSGISRSKAKAILANGGVLVDGKRVTRHDFVVASRQLVQVSKRRDADQGTRQGRRQQRERYYTVVYEDSDVIVVDKAEGVLSMGVGASSLNMKDLLDSYFAQTHQFCRAHVVHRLDVRTSGLMMYAKSVEVQQKLVNNWRDLIIDRRYVAVVEGEMAKEQGHIESWLKDTPSMRIISSRTDNGGKWASTDWRLLRTNGRFSLIELHLHTGRKNQIRVHMRVLCHPIVGDRKYGSTCDPAGRMCLHAYRLAFRHPVTGQELHFETPYPESFTRLLDR